MINDILNIKNNVLQGLGAAKTFKTPTGTTLAVNDELYAEYKRAESEYSRQYGLYMQGKQSKPDWDKILASGDYKVYGTNTPDGKVVYTDASGKSRLNKYISDYNSDYSLAYSNNVNKPDWSKYAAGNGSSEHQRILNEIEAKKKTTTTTTTTTSSSRTGSSSSGRSTTSTPTTTTTTTTTTSTSSGSSSSSSGSSSSSSGSSSSSRGTTTTQTYSISTPNGTKSGLTKAQYDDYSAKVSQYNEAMKLAMNNNLNQPKWSDFEKGDGQTVINDLQRQITAKQMTVPTETQTTRNVATGARQAAEPTVTQPEPTFVENVKETTGENLQQRYAGEGEGEGNGEKSGSSLLVPGLILAGGIIAAVLLTKKSKKRR